MPGMRRPAVVTPPPLDYYLVARPDAILIEEFVFGPDRSAIGLDSVMWTGSWLLSADFSRRLRLDAKLRARVTPVDRHGAEAAYRRLGGGELSGDLPGEETLRARFRDRLPMASAAPLRLTPPRVAEGFHDTRTYRILFADNLSEESIAALRARWRMTGERGDGRVIGTAQHRVGADVFTWDLRRIGPSVAWCLDVTVDLAGAGDDTVGPVLRELTSQMRSHGMIPVTVERFS